MEGEIEARYRALFDTTLDGILIIDDEGRYVDLNPSMARLLKLPREQLLGRSFCDFVPPERLEEAEASFRHLKTVGAFTGELLLRAADGSHVELEWSARANYTPGRHMCTARDVTERKQAEAALRRRQAELADFVENAAVGLHWAGPDGTILWANRAELELLGYSRDEYVGHNMAEFHVDPPVIADILRRLSAGEALNSYEARMRRKDGATRHVIISSNVLWEEGRFVHTRCFTRDITERKQAEEEVQRQRAWLHTTLASIGDAVIATDAAGEVTFMNSVAEQLTGWAQAEAEGCPLAEVFRIVNEQSRQPVASPVEKVLETGHVVGLANHTVLIARDGTEYAIDDSAAPIRDSTGAVAGVVLIFRDITERRRVEIDARRLAAIVESSDDAIVGKDLNGVVTSWNRAAERIFGYTAEEMIGTPIVRIVPPERPNEEAEILARLRRGERIDHFETVRVRKDGARLAVSVTISPIRDPEGDIVGASKVARDITAEKRLREELEQRIEELAEADRRKDHFLAMLAHELRNPLGAISNAVHVLQQPHASDAPRQRALQVLRRQVQHQARMVNELLDVSRITRGLIELHPEPLDLVRVVRDAVEDYRSAMEQERIELRLDLPEAPVPVMGDATRLAQVVSNLLSNALKFTPAGGRVTVGVGSWGLGVGRDRTDRTDQVQPPPPTAHRPPPTAQPPTPTAVLTITDTGIGIEPELLPFVFDSFSQGDRTLARSRGGLGLGLAIVQGLVGLHGGTVVAESEGAGQGTTIRVTLPLHQTAAPAARGADPRPATQRPLRVLVVEDNRDAAQMLQDLLELHGYEVEVALSGPEGVRAARLRHPDVVLCDIGLPGMDGYQVAAALRSDPGGAPQRLIAVTGYGQDEDRRRSREAGFQHHLVKPVDPEELREVLMTLADDMAG